MRKIVAKNPSEVPLVATRENPNPPQKFQTLLRVLMDCYHTILYQLAWYYLSLTSCPSTKTTHLGGYF